MAQVTFYWDDGFTQDYTTIKPIFDREGVKAVSCMATESVEKFHKMTWDLIRELYKDGWEIANHCSRHQTLINRSEGEVTEIFEESQAKFAEENIEVESLVYPSLSNDQVSRKVAKRYFRSAREGIQNGFINYKPYDRYRIRSMWIDSALAKHHKGYTPERLERIHTLVQETAKSNGWLTLFGHSCHYGLEEAENLQNLIKYCKDHGLEFVTCKEALDSE